MENLNLTRDAQMLLALLYKSYKNALKSGESSLNARTLGSIESIQKKTGCIKSDADVLELCKELSRAEMMQCLFADNTIYTSTLTPKAIAYMENRPTAPITAFRLTAQGLDNLSQFTQNSELRRIQTGKQHHRSKSKKRRIKAIVSAIAAIIGTLAALLEILNYIRH